MYPMKRLAITLIAIVVLTLLIKVSEAQVQLPDEFNDSSLADP
ncbi:hypothetical protein ND16A_0717 [Thalassotalea sp. ND16A]|nr:hypothetical protein ND16A_0717 [Thalassotalea sp. ND16A]